MTAADVPSPGFAWLDGRIVPFDQCVVHARSQGAFWGANAFEGLRGYWRPEREELSVFRLHDHLRRLRRSMKSLHMPATYGDDEIETAVVDLLGANGFRQDVHIVVVAYFGLAANAASLPYTEETGLHVTSTCEPRRPTYEHGVSASISSWRRIADDAMPPRIKTGANYHNSRLAHHEAVRNGFDTTLLLNQRGHVSEAPGSCVVMVRDGRLVTPPGTSGVLEGITVDTVERLACDELGLRLERRDIDRTELHAAEELFVCGTLVEIQPVTSVDRLPVGDGTPGPVTRRLQSLYEDVVRGDAGPPEWRTPVPLPPGASATPAARGVSALTTAPATPATRGAPAPSTTPATATDSIGSVGSAGSQVTPASTGSAGSSGSAATSVPAGSPARRPEPPADSRPESVADAVAGGPESPVDPVAGQPGSPVDPVAGQAEPLAGPAAGGRESVAEAQSEPVEV